jgi:hypothetical protein
MNSTVLEGGMMKGRQSRYVTGEHLAAQLKETKAELKGAREENRALQAELLTLVRAEPKGGKVAK